MDVIKIIQYFCSENKEKQKLPIRNDKIKWTSQYKNKYCGRKNRFRLISCKGQSYMRLLGTASRIGLCPVNV